MKKKYKDKDLEEKENLKKKSTWKGDKKKKKKKKATWSDSSDDEKNEHIKDEEVNLCLMANSSEGGYDISDTSPGSRTRCALAPLTSKAREVYVFMLCQEIS